MKENEVNGNVRDDAINNEDNTLLLVRGILGDSPDDKLKAKKYIKDLSQAIFTVVEKHNMAKMRCVGAAALNNAIKAEIIASGEMAKRGKNLAIVPSFKTVTFTDPQTKQENERTAIVLLIKVLEEETSD